MTFLYILKSATVGGAETQLFILARELQKRYNIQPVFIFTRDIGKNELLEKLEMEGIKYRRFNLPFKDRNFLHSILFMRKQIVEHKAHGVISFLDMPSFLSSIAHRLNVYSKFHIWGIRSAAVGFSKKRWFSLAWNLSDIIVSNSLEGCDSFYNTFSGGFHLPKKIHVISNGISLPIIKERTPTRFIRLAMVANNRYPKDYSALIESFANIDARSDMAFELHILGKDTEELKSDVISKSIKSTVKIYGYVSNVQYFLQTNVDIGILLTHYEGQPNTVMEYMASSLPVVATDLDVIRRTVDPLNHPYLIQNNSTEDVVTAITTLASDIQLRQKIGKVNRERIEKDFGVDKMVDSYWDLISHRLSS